MTVLHRRCNGEALLQPCEQFNERLFKNAPSRAQQFEHWKMVQTKQPVCACCADIERLSGILFETVPNSSWIYLPGWRRINEGATTQTGIHCTWRPLWGCYFAKQSGKTVQRSTVKKRSQRCFLWGLDASNGSPNSVDSEFVSSWIHIQLVRALIWNFQENALRALVSVIEILLPSQDEVDDRWRVTYITTMSNTD